MLRRWAAAFFLLALAPSVFIGLVHRVAPTRPKGRLSEAIQALSCLIGLMLLSLVAYAVLELRRRIGKPKSDAWSEYISLRSTGKTLARDRDRRHMPPAILEDEEADP